MLDRPSPPTFTAALGWWLKLGFISFGGPAGQIATMHQELVERRRWISEQRFLHALNFCMLLPGPEAQQLTIYIGWLLHRTWGGVVAGVLFILPGLALLIGLSYIYMAYGEINWVQGIFSGIKPAVVAVVAVATWRIGSRALRNRLLWGFAVASFVAIFFFRLPFPLIVLIAAAAGAIGGKFAPEKFRLGGAHGGAQISFGPAVIDDDTPIPEHAVFSRSRLFLLILFVLALGVVVFASLGVPILRDMAKFFTQAALLTFGGAYAVLPYVYQGAVETFGWLTPTQMIDGLALGETTPGPLIMVVAFVGFVGAYTQQIFGADSTMLFFGGFAGAVVATVFTFLPSFLFVLSGAPLIEATRGDLKFTAPLTGITAAVVGVVANLALFFAWHVLLPQATAQRPFAGSLDVIAAAIAVLAAIAMWRYQVSVVRVIAACALLGLGRSIIF